MYQINPIRQFLNLEHSRIIAMQNHYIIELLIIIITTNYNISSANYS